MAGSARPNLLLIAPAMPDVTGNGLAMRIGHVVEALSASWTVHLLIFPSAGVPGRALPTALAPFVAGCVELPLRAFLDPIYRTIQIASPGADHLAAVARFGRPLAARWDPARVADAAFAAFGSVRFDAVFVMRLYLAELARRWLETTPRPLLLLDADDDDVAAHGRFAALRRRIGDPYGAAIDLTEARHYARWEAAWLPRFDRVFAASPVDAARIAGRVPSARLAVLPNVVRAPPSLPDTGLPPIPLLMVGNFSYLPNVAGAIFLCRDVLPRLRARGVAAQVTLVGGAPLPAVVALAGLTDVELIVGPPDIASFYRRATVAVAPIHAGGGTRIKLVEAFAYGVPVVATTLAAEGLAVRPSRELLLADDAEAFATACATLLEHPALRQLLALQARRLYDARYSMAALHAALASLSGATAGT